MIYTIGHRESYERHFAICEQRDTPLLKLGRTLNYIGGSVWESREAAEAYLAANQPRLYDYAVYGVLADWEADTHQRLPLSFRDLLIDAQLIRLWEAEDEA